MTRKHAKQLVPILSAFADGKIIQCEVAGKWIDLEYPELDSEVERYRVKPDPREFWLVRGTVYTSMQNAEKNQFCDKIIHVREVIPS